MPVLRNKAHDHRPTSLIATGLGQLAVSTRTIAADPMAAPRVKAFGNSLHAIIDIDLDEIRYRAAHEDRCSCCGAIPGTPAPAG